MRLMPDDQDGRLGRDANESEDDRTEQDIDWAGAAGRRPTGLAPLDEDVDHARGPRAARLILEYGDYECPYSRHAFRAIEYVEQELRGRIRFAFRHFPLVQIHPHAFGAAAAAEAAALQDCFWAMHGLLFQSQKALEDDDLRQYAERLGLDVARFDEDRVGPDVRRRIRRDVETGLALAQVRGTPTLFIDGVMYVGRYDAASLTEALDTRCSECT